MRLGRLQKTSFWRDEFLLLLLEMRTIKKFLDRLPTWIRLLLITAIMYIALNLLNLLPTFSNWCDPLWSPRSNACCGLLRLLPHVFYDAAILATWEKNDETEKTPSSLAPRWCYALGNSFRWLTVYLTG